MEHNFITDHISVTRVSNAVAAGTTVIDSSSVDMAGYKGVMFVVLYGTLTATQVTNAAAEQSSDDGSSDAFAVITGTTTTAMADDDDNQVDLIDVWKPTEQYVRCTVNRATANAVVDGILAIRYGALDRGTSQGSNIHETTQTIGS